MFAELIRFDHMTAQHDMHCSFSGPFARPQKLRGRAHQGQARRTPASPEVSQAGGKMMKDVGSCLFSSCRSGSLIYPSYWRVTCGIPLTMSLTISICVCFLLIDIRFWREWGSTVFRYCIVSAFFGRVQSFVRAVHESPFGRCSAANTSPVVRANKEVTPSRSKMFCEQRWLDRRTLEFRTPENCHVSQWVDWQLTHVSFCYTDVYTEYHIMLYRMAMVV